MLSTKPQTETELLKSKVATCLETLGWLRVDDGAAIARKSFSTAVGPKEALAYLTKWRPSSGDVILSGEYQSQGRNALETVMIQIPREASQELIDSQVASFVERAAATISETYAAKLLRAPFRP